MKSVAFALDALTKTSAPRHSFVNF